MNVLERSLLACIVTSIVAALPTLAFAEERRITGDKLQKLLAGKRAVDIARGDHWFELNPNGTGVVASRAIEFPTTFESTDSGWCRTMSVPEGVRANTDRFKKVAHRCQAIGYDGESILFYDKDGSPTNRFRIE